MKSLTVGITYFNEGNLLTECLNSLLAQANPPEEILIFDDASTKPAKDFLPSHDGRIRILRADTNSGPAVGRNRLLSAASGEFLHFHDSDDWFDARWTEKVREKIDTDQFDAVFTEVSSHREGKLVCEKVVGLEFAKKDLLAFCIEHFMLVPTGTYRRSFLQAVGGYRESLWQSEDFDFHVRLATHSPHYCLIETPLVHIRLRPESRSQNRAETCRDAFFALKFLLAEVPDSYRYLLGEKAAVLGAQLFQLGERGLAREAFAFAREHKAKYKKQRASYRFIASYFGQELAEKVGATFRRAKAFSARASKEPVSNN